MEQEHGTVWGAIRNEVELAQKKSEESTVITLKMQVLKIDHFTKKMGSTVRASISRIKELTYAFSQLRHHIEHLENLENKRSGREDESSLGEPQWMGGSQEK